MLRASDFSCHHHHNYPQADVRCGRVSALGSLASGGRVCTQQLLQYTASLGFSWLLFWKGLGPQPAGSSRPASFQDLQEKILKEFRALTRREHSASRGAKFPFRASLCNPNFRGVQPRFLKRQVVLRCSSGPERNRGSLS